ncbi:MAG: T9SS type A sorting domain-containing protein [Sphingobacteriales bacterium]|nr:MAG: T9SS type A sorting domain-containing protein [Sphingobacteriales bacterium]
MRKTWLTLFVIGNSLFLSAQWLPQVSGTTEKLNSIHVASDGITAWAVGNNATILKTINGTTWLPQADPQSYDNLDVFFLPDNQTGWIATGGGILKTTNGGTLWTYVFIGPYNFWSVHFFNASEGLIVGQSRVFTTSNGGNTWTQVNITSPATLRSLQFGSDVNSAWVVGDDINTGDPYIYKLNRSGIVWSPVLQYSGNAMTTPGSLNDVSIVDNSYGIAVGHNRTNFRTNDGSNWTVKDLSGVITAAELLAAHSYDKYNTYAVGDDGSIAYTKDGGVNWLADNSGTTETLRDVYIATNTIGYVVGDNGTILKKANLVLPISLSSFTAKSQNKKIFLNWSTSMELNNTGFAVMRKPVNGNHEGEQVGFVRSFGNSNKTQSYSFVDEPKGGDQFLYQLKQIDIDGKSTLSNILKVKLQIDAISLSSYPNPSRDNSTINYSVPVETNVQLIIKNQMGQIVKTVINGKQAAGNYAISLNCNELTSGVYYAELHEGKEKVVAKLSIQR